MIPQYSLVSACEILDLTPETPAGISLFPSWVTAQPWHKQTFWSSSSGVLSCREETMQDMQDLVMLVPGQDSSTELSTNCFYWQENKGDEVGSYCRVHELTVGPVFKGTFWKCSAFTSNVKAQCWSRLRFECQLHFYWPSVTSKDFSSTDVQTGRLPWNLSAMLSYRIWTDFICRLIPENEY